MSFNHVKVTKCVFCIISPIFCDLDWTDIFAKFRFIVYSFFVEQMVFFTIYHYIFSSMVFFIKKVI